MKYFKLILYTMLLLQGVETYAQEAVSGEANSTVSEAQEAQTSQTKPEPDYAYGAFQRGQYLTAFSLALPRAEAGDAAAQTLIAELYEKGLGIPRNSKEAAVWYKIAASAGNREAQFSYAQKLIQGVDVEKDQKAGYALMEKAAEAGHPLAMFNYANQIIAQRPTGAGYRQALPYLKRAAEYRLSDAYYSLSQIYEAGSLDGIQRPKVAREWLIRAARAGIDTAQIDMALSLLNAEGEERNEVQAFRWFTMAANQGNVIARNRLAHMYWRGIGTDQSMVEAAKWHFLAKKAGRGDLELEEMLLDMDEETRKKAIALANQWPAG